jgi:SAP domain
MQQDLSKLKLVELKALCKDKNMLTTGTKATLIARLTNTAVVKKTEGRPAKVIKKIESGRPVLILKRNKFNNFTDPSTSFVFSKDKKVIGKEGVEGEVIPLTTEDVECIKDKRLDYDESKLKNSLVQDNATDRLKELEHFLRNKLSTTDLESEDENE